MQGRDHFPCEAISDKPGSWKKQLNRTAPGRYRGRSPNIGRRLGTEALPGRIRIVSKINPSKVPSVVRRIGMNGSRESRNWPPLETRSHEWSCHASVHAFYLSFPFSIFFVRSSVFFSTSSRDFERSCLMLSNLSWPESSSSLICCSSRSCFLFNSSSSFCT